MKNQLTSFILFFTVVFFTSCSHLSNLSVEKRHYRGGYHVDYAKRNSPEAAPANNKSVSVEEKASVSTGRGPAMQAVPAELLPEVPAAMSKEKGTGHAAPVKNGVRSAGAAKGFDGIKEIKKPFQAVRNAPAIMKELKKSNNGNNGWIIILIVIILILWLLGRWVFFIDLIDLLLLILVILLILWLIKSL